MLVAQDEADALVPPEKVLLVPELVVRESTRGIQP
jgi:hypothetical protein